MVSLLRVLEFGIHFLVRPGDGFLGHERVDRRGDLFLSQCGSYRVRFPFPLLDVWMAEFMGLN